MLFLIVIDGLFTKAGDAFPSLDNLVAGGKVGQVDWNDDPNLAAAGSALFRICNRSLPAPGSDLPTAYYAALGLGLNPDPARIWSHLAFTHLLRKREKLLIMSPQRTGQTPAEAIDLANSLNDLFTSEDWQLHAGDGSNLLVSRSQLKQISCRPLKLLEGDSFLESMPAGEAEVDFRRLLNSSQLELHHHPLNQQRKEAGRSQLNTAWFWGIGQGDAGDNTLHGWHCLAEDPAVRGLVLAAGGEAQAPENGSAAALAVASGDKNIIFWDQPATLLRHGQVDDWRASLLELEASLLMPLAQRYPESKIVLTAPNYYDEKALLVAGPVPWVAGSAALLGKKRRFWQRQSLEGGAVMSGQEFGKLWLK